MDIRLDEKMELEKRAQREVGLERAGGLRGLLAEKLGVHLKLFDPPPQTTTLEKLTTSPQHRLSLFFSLSVFLFPLFKINYVGPER